MRVHFIPSFRAGVPAALQAVLALALFSPIFPAGAQSRPTPAKATHPIERSRDAYAIYSLLMPGEALAKIGPSQNQRWAIAETTVNARDISPALAPEAALKAPEKRARDFHEAVRDYEARKNERLLLTRDFHLDRPYALLTPAEVDEFRAARTSPSPGSALRQKYDGYPGITYFSQVFFNSDRTAALVYMVDWCGNLCAGAEWVYLEKQGSHWVRRSGAPQFG